MSDISSSLNYMGYSMLFGSGFPDTIPSSSQTPKSIAELTILLQSRLECSNFTEPCSMKIWGFAQHDLSIGGERTIESSFSTSWYFFLICPLLLALILLFVSISRAFATIILSIHLVNLAPVYAGGRLMSH